MDLKTIKEAAEREVARNGPNEYPAAYNMRRDADRAILLDAVPAMLAEIDRRGSEIVKARNDRDVALAEVERLRERSAETIDLRVEGAAELRAAGETIERLRLALRRARRAEVRLRDGAWYGILDY